MTIGREANTRFSDLWIAPLVFMVVSASGGLVIEAGLSLDPPAGCPFLFVCPAVVTANATNEEFTVAVSICNLTDAYIEDPDSPGDFVSLGNLVGFTIAFRWNPMLDYVAHTITAPVEEYPDPIPPSPYAGSLHEPLFVTEDEVNASAGTYVLALFGLGGEPFNGNGTLFTITFRYTGKGSTGPLTIENATLADAEANTIGKTATGRWLNEPRDGLLTRTGAVYIEANGSIDPPTAPIASTDNVTYTLTDNLSETITIGRDNMVLDGAGHTVTMSRDFPRPGPVAVAVGGCSNVTIIGLTIVNSAWGIGLQNSSYTSIHDNEIAYFVDFGVWLDNSSYNTVAHNNIQYCAMGGIVLSESDNNTIDANNVTGSFVGAIQLSGSRWNTLSWNTLVANDWGILLGDSTDNLVCNNTFVSNSFAVEATSSVEVYNRLYHNNFIDSGIGEIDNIEYVWDNGYPSGGNYWSDYVGADLCSGIYQNESGSDGIGDTPYAIDEANTDRYPLIKPDLAVSAVKKSRTIAGRGGELRFNVTVLNRGIHAASFNFTVSANSIVIYSLTNATLAGKNSTIIAVEWNTSSVEYGEYVITAHVSPIPGEAYTGDNAFFGGSVCVTIAGDMNGDYDVDIFDIVSLAGIYGTQHPPAWPLPPQDLDGDGDVDIFDLVKAASNYGKHWSPSA